MPHSAQAKASRKPRRLLKHQTPPVKAVKTFACKVSASFRRQTASARQRYVHTFHQLEAKLLNSEQGEAGLIFAVPNIPAHINPAELASAFNDTLARLCNDSRQINFSSTSLSPDSTYTKDLLDFEYEKHSSTQTPPQTTSTSTPDLLLSELSDFSTVVESDPTSQASVDELLCRHGLDGLQAPLLPTTNQYPTVKGAKKPLQNKESPLASLDFLGSLSFDDLNPYPLITEARTAKRRATKGIRVGVTEAGNKKALRRKHTASDLAQGRTDNLRNSDLPKSLRPGPLNLNRAVLPRPVPRPLATRSYMSSEAASSPYVAYQRDRAPLLPVPSTTSKTLIEEIANELDNVLAAFDIATEDEIIPDEANSEAQRQGLHLKALQLAVPLRLSSRKVSETTPEKSLSFKDRLLDASRSAILAAADEAETSELRWFHCRT